MELHERISPKDVEIARLRELVAQLKEERDLWQARALTANGTEGGKDKAAERFIVISAKKLKEVLSKIHDVHILSLVSFVLQKALPKEGAAENGQLVSEIVPLPQSPSLTLKADGDVKVEGDWNDVHHNGAVNF